MLMKKENTKAKQTWHHDRMVLFRNSILRFFQSIDEMPEYFQSLFNSPETAYCHLSQFHYKSHHSTCEHLS